MKLIQMKRTGLLLLLFFAVVQSAFGQMYSKAFGEKGNPAIIFLHGGPGYNSFTFEASTAERVSKEGYYVIVFDQRGSGRSDSMSDSKYTFEEATTDVNNIYEEYEIEKAVLIGHSWGGTLGLVFAERYPSKVNSLILVGAPMSYPQTFKAILKNAKAAYVKDEKQQQLNYLKMLEKMDTTSIIYANYCFMHAMASGLYSTEHPAANAGDIKNKMKQSEDIRQASYMTQAPVKGFYDNEHYTILVLYKRLKDLTAKVPVYGIYGSDDGLFDSIQLQAISDAIGKPNFTIVKNASHSVFIDQQEEFIEKLKRYLN